MPPLPPAGNIVRFDFHYQFGTNSNVQNRCFHRYTGTPTQTDLNSWANSAGLAWQSHLAPLLHTTLTLSLVETTSLASASAPVGSAAIGFAGTDNTGPGVPANVAMTIAAIINRRYRGGHPRWYQVGLLQNNMLDEDHWTAGVLNSWATNFKAFSDAIAAWSTATTTGGVPVNVSYVSNHTWAQDQHGNWHKIPTYRGTPTVDDITAFEPRILIGTQRRRVK